MPFSCVWSFHGHLLKSCLSRLFPADQASGVQSQRLLSAAADWGNSQLG